MTSPLVHKRGDSFLQIGTIPSIGFAPQFFLGWTPYSTMRTSDGRVIAEMEAEWVDPSTVTKVKVLCTDTSKWPLGNAMFDLRFVNNTNGFVYTSKFRKVVIAKDHSD